ncbi:putative C2H2 transcription factor (Ace1) [Aspergillus clavatus NRRL 1]|uniref:C2H2 type zinc finger domain protein n=1 Tax=Aspergillus clavatus (strain ATCC 1007 / CBS 513.65 / DSM 816 / NCTC 3887 / NRRL 1 / QM 1276 / 107) TaxID=344612 RepID=A1CJR7_ASPCL|nr:C2H2 type zinc finger domain protein [Aspergillus clavatus NRRL 1]EAW09391.1 C2H2 type zinc finger domain protein [Aspergillus clavatus NRRL 1]
MSAPQAEPTRIHPRRRPLKTAPPSLITSASPESHDGPSSPYLRRAETFHSPSPASGDQDPVLNFRTLPRRSPTCPRSLEAIAAGEQRMANILNHLDLDSLDATGPLNSSSDNDLPVPRGVLQAHFDSEPLADKPTKRPHSPQMEPPRKVRKSHSHASDSGLGTSLGSEALSASNKSKVKAGQLSFEPQVSGMSGSQMTQSAITSSISAINPKQIAKYQLGARACKQIEKNLLVPILGEEKLKAFHPLVRSVPQRIVSKEINCLRDLEKTLLWLAPHYATTRASYIGFCEFTIQCLYSTVQHLNSRDQRLPTDRPYTNGYFLDLVAQIHQYAAMINASRNQMSSNEKPARASASSSDPVTLEGGLSKNGRPAELVVHKDGEMISLRTGKPYEEGATPSIKRSLSIGSVDEGVERSMARRKKNAPPMDINQKCKDCDKVFKRPCDLTKHEKTHSRPWKCNDDSCKYFEVGWPTEKERDRHINDKHSKAPALYKCTFAPCSYQSKRESNCKQHMEKAHGWVYVRSKHNGRNSKKASTRAASQTPSIATPSSKAQEILTPATRPTPSPFESVASYPQNPPFSFADPPTQTASEDFPLFTETGPYADLAGGVNAFSPLPTTSLDFQAFQSQLEAADPNGLILPSDFQRQSLDSASPVPDLVATSMGFDGSPIASTDTSSLNFDLDWNQLEVQNLDEEFTTLNMQLLTPPSSSEVNALNSFSRDPSISNASPLQHSGLPFYSPSHCHMDEGVAGLQEHTEQKKLDFPLYGHQANLGLGAMDMSHPCHLPGMQNLDQMFPPLDVQDSIAYMNQGWPQDVDMDLF